MKRSLIGACIGTLVGVFALAAVGAAAGFIYGGEAVGPSSGPPGPSAALAGAFVYSAYFWWLAGAVGGASGGSPGWAAGWYAPEHQPSGSVPALGRIAVADRDDYGFGIRAREPGARTHELTVAKPAPRLPKVVTSLQANLHHDLLIVDYYQFISEATGFNLTQQLEIISNELKRFALENLKPLVLLAQLNRSIESDSVNPEPQLSDLRGCGDLEQDAHAVSFLWDENAKPAMRKPGEAM